MVCWSNHVPVAVFSFSPGVGKLTRFLVQISAVSASEMQRKAKTKSLHSLIRDHGCLSGWDSFWQILKLDPLRSGWVDGF